MDFRDRTLPAGEIAGVSAAFDLLLPRTCAGCDAAGATWCAACDAELEPYEIPAPAGAGWAAALAGYPTAVGRALRVAKYGRDRARMVQLAARFAAHGAPLAVGHDAIVPVPTPWTRAGRRGFAAAAVLAAALARRSGVPVVSALRVAPGPRQAGLGAVGRARNLAGRLRAARPAGGRVLLVDDVLTTGATAEAAARELLGDCTTRVDVLVLCATDRHGA